VSIHLPREDCRKKGGHPSLLSCLYITIYIYKYGFQLLLKLIALAWRLRSLSVRSERLGWKNPQRYWYRNFSKHVSEPAKAIARHSIALSTINHGVRFEADSP
jgi:hypothetical protein